MKILLLSTYELGHQPIQLAWPRAALESAGFQVGTADLSLEAFPAETLQSADLVAISAPMHTALRLAVEAARQVRALRSQAHICFYGLYAGLNGEYLFAEGLADSLTAGEAEPVLVDLARALEQGRDPSGIPGLAVPGKPAGAAQGRWEYPVPRRDGLPELAAYAHLEHAGEQRLAGYTETTRGCLHTCRHCPVVPVYGGRFYAVPLETVLADIRQQVESGARHITFGDPDFLNGPTHALRIARSLHAEFHGLTFDFTAKVEHLLNYRDLLPELVSLGALFAISAFESTSDTVLAKLKKGHTCLDMEQALNICAAAGLPLQPTWVAFTPWTKLSDYIEMLDWIYDHGLVENVPVVQYSVRLLVPPGSALLQAGNGHSGDAFTRLDPPHFTYQWRHQDARMDELQEMVADLAEAGSGSSPYETFAAVEGLARKLAGLPLRASPPASPVPAAAPPRLTEDWFC